MRERFGAQPAPRRRRWAAAIVATALLASLAGATWAQDASDSTTVDIVVRPAGGPPVPAPTPTPAPGQPPVPQSPTDTPILLAPPAPPVLGARQAPMPGTVSARIALLQPQVVTDRVDDTITSLIVGDDRGTAAGWDVSLASTPPARGEWTPTLMENRDETIRRLLPAIANSTQQLDGVHGGRVVGAVVAPMPVLNAGFGSGSGVYQQQLVVVVPAMEVKTEHGIVLVQLYFAP